VIRRRRKSKEDACQWTERVLPTTLDAIREAEAEVIGLMEALGYSEEQRLAVRLAAEEALVNAMKHGNQMDPHRRVYLRFSVLPERVEICVCDEGQGFDPARVPDPTAGENLHKPCGRGIMLMRSYMDKVSFVGHGCEVRMVKFRETQA
jgi:serine/threonine-protein kinase RsbW